MTAEGDSAISTTYDASERARRKPPSQGSHRDDASILLCVLILIRYYCFGRCSSPSRYHPSEISDASAGQVLFQTSLYDLQREARELYPHAMASSLRSWSSRLQSQLVMHKQWFRCDQALSQGNVLCGVPTGCCEEHGSFRSRWT